MKEAAGEANMTVITIVLIAVVLGVGTVIVNSMMRSTQRRACCQSLGGSVAGNNCNINGNLTPMNDRWLETSCPDQ